MRRRLSTLESFAVKAPISAALPETLGEQLGCGAYMSELRRTRIGDFKVDDAYSIERFEEMIKALT